MQTIRDTRTAIGVTRANNLKTPNNSVIDPY